MHMLHAFEQMCRLSIGCLDSHCSIPMLLWVQFEDYVLFVLSGASGLSEIDLCDLELYLQNPVCFAECVYCVQFHETVPTVSHIS